MGGRATMRSITPGVFPGSMREDTIRYFAEAPGQHGRKVASRQDRASWSIATSPIPSEQAIEEYGEYLMYLFNTLLRYDQVWQKEVQQDQVLQLDRVRAPARGH